MERVPVLIVVFAITIGVQMPVTLVVPIMVLVLHSGVIFWLLTMLFNFKSGYMKKPLKDIVRKFESARTSGGFAVFSNVRGGKLPNEQEGSVNDYCSGTNPSGCSNKINCSTATNNLGCSNYGTCFAG